MSDIKPLIGIAADRALTRDEAEEAFGILFDGEATPAQIGGLLMALRTRGETVDEYAAAAAVMRAKCNRLASLQGEIQLISANLPSGYHRDLQLLKEHTLPAFAETEAFRRWIRSRQTADRREAFHLDRHGLIPGHR